MLGPQQVTFHRSPSCTAAKGVLGLPYWWPFPPKSPLNAGEILIF